ncbi:nucleotide-binding oligomerization domain-containing protein 1 isoform X2 [Protopterus annectens]|uniref:nucleotide-binding oligomerization domain-containing protein 1 isoform X2 n=1 Tax=Protopterus annectens TaxID=7888 RepID=UPI001CFB2E6E|nr:nucleotide-binding oligomerization domain-containing protein 1 isoform X2 [Protopterus annectens]
MEEMRQEIVGETQNFINVNEQAPLIQRISVIKILNINRELLVSKIKNTQCILDSLIKVEYFSNEDVEIATQFPTQSDKVRKILELVASKGEEVAEYFLFILYQVSDAFVDLIPWFKEIHYQPSEQIKSKPVVNSDPVSQYIGKLRHELIRDTKFMVSYAQKEESMFEDVYAETLIELLDKNNDILGNVTSTSDIFNENGVINEDAETIFITGDAGVGKSILLQKLQNSWAKKEIGTDIKFFFRFRCRMFSTFKKEDQISLKDLLFKYNCYPDLDLEEVFSYLLRFPQTVLFTFDGFDEINSSFDLNSIPEVSSPYHPTHPLALLINLLSGKLLNGSKKILTARTGTELQKKIIRKKLVLKGFSPDSLKKYTQAFFKDEALHEQVLNHLEANPHLCSLCSIPLFCWIIFQCFAHFQSVYGILRLPDCYVTLTDVYLLMTEIFLSKSAKANLLKKNNRSQTETFCSGKSSLTSLCKLAECGTEKGDFIFEQDEMTSLNIPEPDLKLGFLRVASSYSGCGDQSTYEFLHITMQSFFTAFSLVMHDAVSSKELLKYFTLCEHTEEKQFRALPLNCIRASRTVEKDPFQNNEHFQFINLFLCGLLSKTKHRLLQLFIPPSIIKKKRILLKRYLFKTVKTHLKNLPRCKLGEFNKVQAMPQFIWMLRCIYETQSEDMGKLAAKGICADYLKLTFCNAFSADCSAISFVLCHCRKQIALELDNNNVNDYGVKELIPCFNKLNVIRLSVNMITDFGVEILSEELLKHKIVTFLGLYKNQITDAGARLVARVIEECPSLKTLKIGANKITSEGGKILAQAIQKSRTIFDVGMWGNSIGDEGAKAFATALRNHPSLTNLSLAFNGISTEGGKCIAEALKENSSVRIFWLTQNEFNDEVAENFAEMLRVNRTLTNLCLQGNPITSEEAEAFENENRMFF